MFVTKKRYERDMAYHRAEREKFRSVVESQQKRIIRLEDEAGDLRRQVFQLQVDVQALMNREARGEVKQTTP